MRMDKTKLVKAMQAIKQMANDPRARPTVN